MKWDSKLYDNAQSFVSEYGKGLIELLPRKEGMKVLDLGSGTGDLTYEISKTLPAEVVGVDSSPDMIKEAKGKYGDIEFALCDACEILYINEFDAVFSNAVFHWIANQPALHGAIYRALKIGGSLVCEFGAVGNIGNISASFGRAVERFGGRHVSPFYFPTIDRHRAVLEGCGFIVDSIYDYDRPTALPNGELGLRQWICQFYSADLERYTEGQQEIILQAVEGELREGMFDGEKWTADYRRLRVVAHK